MPCVVAINKFTSDTQAEIDMVQTAVEQFGCQAVPCDVWGKGGNGAIDLANTVIDLCQQDNSSFTFSYQDSDTVEEKIFNIATKIYGAKGVVLSDKAKQSLQSLAPLGIDKLPVVIAKTQYSFSDDAKLLGAPTGFDINIRDIEYRGGAGFLVALAGNMLLMPGLPRVPNAVNMTIDEDGVIDGLY